MTAHPSPAPILSRPLAISDVSPDGTTVRVVATEAERRALARDIDIPSIESLEAELTVRPWARTGFRMTGRVRASVTQTCVVTLEPVAQVVDEPVDVKFVPPSEAAKYAAARDEDGEVVLDAEAEDPPDVFEGGTLDPGAVAEEYMVLGLDPYPRKPGVAFEPVAESRGGAEAPASPFAALAKLKRD
ncbi:YceD family protein [Prosthecomicrobium sp. N25]|uniref:YceD family protein n=1 Tax=Prosthecomicrobium sp. N25 TaxID=3129254 RepID=UPI0030772822